MSALIKLSLDSQKLSRYNSRRAIRYENINMKGIYSIQVYNYGLYVCNSYNIEESIKKHFIFLDNKIHHNYVLQRLYNLFPENFIVKDSIEVTNIDKLPFLTNLYRLKFPFTLDSYMTYQYLDKWYLFHKYKHKSPELYIYIDQHNLAYIYDANNLLIGIELGDNFQSGRYIFDKYNIRKI